jgi:hypothetical protein
MTGNKEAVSALGPLLRSTDEPWPFANLGPLLAHCLSHLPAVKPGPHLTDSQSAFRQHSETGCPYGCGQLHLR